MELDYTCTRITLDREKKYLTLPLNDINIWFFTPHNICLSKIVLGCIWTILLDIINYTKEWGNILDMLLVYMTMKCDTQSSIISTVMWIDR